MKRSELFFSLLQIPLDALMIVGAFLLSYYFRVQYEVSYILPLGQYLIFLVSALPLWILVFSLQGLYRIDSTRRGIDEAAGIFVGVSTGVLLVLAALFLTNTDLGSRLTLLIAYFLTLVTVSLGRFLMRSLQKKLYSLGIGTRRVVFIGGSQAAYYLIKEMADKPHLGYQNLGYVGLATDEEAEYDLGRRLGQLRSLESIIERTQPDEIIVADGLSEKQLFNIRRLSSEKLIDLKLTPNISGTQTAQSRFQILSGIPLIEIQRTPLQGWGRIIKRAADVVFSFFLIIFFSPLMLITALAVKLTSPGPIIYKNKRVGLNKNQFYVYKFRTMKAEFSTGSEYGGKKALELEKELIKKQNTRKGALYKISNDPRLTPIGNFLRKSSLDEFPQFFNVLFGSMSLIGPRPHQPREVADYQSWQMKLLAIKPGVTGLSQISGRSDLDFDDEANLDISYIENWSFWLDLKILLMTPYVLLRDRNRKAA
ncbi:sugar transferase [Candidatus Berkelbacteria bacterium]|nr:sugar transferase [Candidatus Berkelbacteria bacterium]